MIHCDGDHGDTGIITFGIAILTKVLPVSHNTTPISCANQYYLSPTSPNHLNMHLFITKLWKSKNNYPSSVFSLSFTLTTLPSHHTYFISIQLHIPHTQALFFLKRINNNLFHGGIKITAHLLRQYA